MKKHLRSILLALLAVVFIGSSAMVLVRRYEEEQAQLAQEAALAAAQAAAEAAAVEQLPEEPVPLAPEPVEEEPVQDPLAENAQFLLELDLEALRQTNEDVLGWIHIPDSPIDFPLMMSEDNADYLNTTWDGRRSSLGSIFLECRSRRDFTDFNTILYGHNIKGGKMFGSLHWYREQAYQEQHPFVYLVTDGGVLRYEIFAAYEAPVTSDTYRLYFKDDEQKLSALEHYLGSSVWSTGRGLSVEDRILTLSTCTGTGRYETRWVVQAVLTGEFTE